MDYWNRRFTDLIRRTYATRWGNWGLDLNINPGAVGILDPDSGAFRLLKESLPNLDKSEVIKQAHNSDWDMMTSHVSRSETDIKLDGEVTDPDTGLTGKAGVKVTWSMSKKGAIVSQCAMDSQATLKDSDAILKKNFDWLKGQAKASDMVNSEGIRQGFGVVTSVLYARSGLNVASQSDDNSFSITGSVTGVHKMLGEASGSGSYTKTSASKSVDKHIWPSKANEVSSHPFPIAYTFASYDGENLFPTWIEPVSSFEVYIDNNHGGTYIVKSKLSYDTSDGRKTREASTSGGLTSAIGGIPLDASNLDLRLEFVCIGSNEVKHFKWGNPRAEWPTGVRHIDITGVWPGSTHAKIRETGESR